uniref:histidine kinase n=1 Tax=Solibacter usitatus (strain Ellin6076) TaxID=234267 RepID=Q02A70_SOLUE
MKGYASLRRKLATLIAGGGVVTALIAAAGFSWLDLQRFQQQANAQVTAIANIVAGQVEPSIALGDRRVAAEILQSLRGDRMIRDAILYDGEGECFAVARALLAACPPRPRDGLKREREAIVLVRPVLSGGERVGTLVLAASVPSIREVLGQYLGGAALIMALTLLVAGVLAMVLQARVSAPILAIARVAERITQTHQFDDRVAVDSSDELGVLARSFNTMLEEIARSGAELEQQIMERNRVNAELLAAKERAEDAARQKTQFLANMSHEIRTPMNGVMGMISLVLDHELDSQDREHLLMAQSAAQSLIIILNDILDLSKIEAGKMTFETVDFDLHRLIGDAMGIFSSAAIAKGLDLGIDLAPDSPRWVRGDPVRLRQILINLVGNAVKFTAAGSVRLTLAPHLDNLVRFAVRDTGIGVPKDQMEAIFEAFVQADGSHTRQFGGTGLGLAITRRLVALMEGTLWAESQSGCGSTFFVELPVQPGSAVQSLVAMAESAPGELPPVLRVLVAEDNVINQKVICSMLRRQGWTVTLALNGEEAYRRFLESRFDLILMDVQMPEVDGLESSRRIRQAERNHKLGRIPILALTAHAATAQHKQCLAAGMDAVITKPVNFPAMLAQIAAVLPEGQTA